MAHQSLGPCCICGKAKRSVRNIICLNKKSPIAGHGWGCVVCGQPPDGALAVLCDRCVADPDYFLHLVWACKGYPRTEGRVPIGELVGTQEHDMRLHPGEG